ncbi:MAG: GNAT family N-acetyltransferase [Candidatus Weimeria sp.]
MQLRKYQSADCEELADLFYQTVHCVNARDYTKTQLNAWASGQIDLRKWDKSFLEHYTIVAVQDDEILGFGDMADSGYLDRLFVRKDHQGEGIATAICDELEGSVSGKRITTCASITAEPFFLKRGYHVVRRQEVERNGVSLTNYLMEKLVIAI